VRRGALSTRPQDAGERPLRLPIERVAAAAATEIVLPVAEDSGALDRPGADSSPAPSASGTCGDGTASTCDVAGADPDYHRRDLYQAIARGGPVDDPAYREPPLRISGDADRWDHRAGNEDFSQAGALYRLMSEEEKTGLVENIVAAMKGVPRAIRLRQVGREGSRPSPLRGRAPPRRPAEVRLSRDT